MSSTPRAHGWIAPRLQTRELKLLAVLGVPERSQSSRQHQNDSLSHAKDFAEDWFLELKGKVRRGEAPGGGVTFDKAADQFLREFLALTAGERSPIYVKGHQDRLRVHLRPFFGKKGLAKSPRDLFKSTAFTG